MTSSSNLTDKSEQRFRNLALLTILIIYLLILAGGIVRGTGSGMGCPDWPRCFGRWVPPTEAYQLPPNYQEIYGAKLKGEVEFNPVKTWIEYVNRLLGVLSGFFVFATLITSYPYLRRDKAVFLGSVAAFLLIGANGWLGSRVVATELAQYMISLHLLLAIIVVFSLLFVFVRSNPHPVSAGLRENKALGRLVLITMLLTLGQVMLGTLVRESLDKVVKLLGYEQRASWIENLDWQFYVHRSFSLIVFALQVGVIYRLRQFTKNKLLTNIANSLIILILFEIATGIIMAYMEVPAVAQPIHLFLAVLIIGLQFVAWLMLTPRLLQSEKMTQTSHILNV